jgi:hypothetical protein
MGGGFLVSPYPVPPPVPSHDPKLDPAPAYFVRVCGFTFEFWSVPQIEAALRFYREKTHPGSRMPNWGEHDVTQRWYERAPLYLQENGKRERVVKALERALKEFTEPGSVDGQPLCQTRKM